MDPPAFPFTEDELNKAGLLGEGESFNLLQSRTFVPEPLAPATLPQGEPYPSLTCPSTHSPIHTILTMPPSGVSERTKQVMNTMKEHPDLLSKSPYLPLRLSRANHLTSHPELSLFTLQCINLHTQPRIHPSSPPVPSSSVPSSDVNTTSNPSPPTSIYRPDEYERTSYYNGISGTTDASHPHLIYRSNYLSTPFPKPTGRHAHIPIKSLRGVFDTPLNDVWDTVGPQIRDLMKKRGVEWRSIDPVRFFTHPALGAEEGGEEGRKGSLGPVVIWVGVRPGSTDADTAHEVSQEILGLLEVNGVEGVVVEWHEVVMAEEW